MWLHLTLLTIHVLTAVLGIGGVTGLAIVVSVSSRATPAPVEALNRLVLTVNISLAIMLLSGIGLLYDSNWALAAAWWLRVAFILFLVLGGSLGFLRATLRKMASGGTAASPGVLRRVAVTSGVQCALVAAIVLLMVVKPF